MANRLLPRRSNTASAVPTTGDLLDGELAVNTADKKIYMRVGAAIVELVPAGTSPVAFGIACGSETSTLTTGAAKATFRMPMAITNLAIRASLNVAEAAGNLVTVDINVNGVSILSTKLTFDLTEKTSLTAATQAVLTTTTLADDDEITVDIDQIGGAVSGAKGLKVWIIGRAP